MNMHTPVVRGILTVQANSNPIAALIGELNTAFAEFKQKNSANLEEVRSEVHELASRFAGLQIGSNY